MSRLLRLLLAPGFLPGNLQFLLGSTLFRPVWYSRLIELAVRMLFLYACYVCVFEPLSKMLVLSMTLVKVGSIGM